MATSTAGPNLAACTAGHFRPLQRPLRAGVMPAEERGTRNKSGHDLSYYVQITILDFDQKTALPISANSCQSEPEKAGSEPAGASGSLFQPIRARTFRLRKAAISGSPRHRTLKNRWRSHHCIHDGQAQDALRAPTSNDTRIWSRWKELFPLDAQFVRGTFVLRSRSRSILKSGALSNLKSGVSPNF